MMGTWVIGIYIYCPLQKIDHSHLSFVYDNNCHIQILDEKYQNLYMTYVKCPNDISISV